MRAFKNLREFLTLLAQEKQLLHIKEEVNPEPDLAAAARALTQLGNTSPAIYFDQVKGYKTPIVMNAHGSWPNHALMLGMDKETSPRDQFFEFVRRYQQFPGVIDRQASAPWQEIVIDKDINLFDILPLFRLNQGDGGFYIDKACIISRDPDDWKNEDIQNLGIYRLQVKGKNKLGIQPIPQHDIAIHLKHAEERGEDLPIAIAIGNEPIISVVAGMPILYNQSEYKMAAVIQGKPYPVVTNEKGLDIPFGAAYVLEGRIIGRKREPEGPFGEFTGQYSGGRKYPVIEIDRVFHCKNPVYESLYLGMPWTEIDYMVAINTSAPLYVQIKNVFPEIVAINATYIHGLVVVVSTKCRYGGFAKAIGLHVLSTQHGLGYAKLVIVVDEQVDPFNMNEVMCAVATRMNPAADVIITPNLSINPLDPGGEPEGISHKMIIDATIPIFPDKRGNYSEQLTDPQGTEEWQTKLSSLLKELRK